MQKECEQRKVKFKKKWLKEELLNGYKGKIDLIDQSGPHLGHTCRNPLQQKCMPQRLEGTISLVQSFIGRTITQSPGTAQALEESHLPSVKTCSGVLTWSCYQLADGRRKTSGGYDLINLSQYLYMHCWSCIVVVYVVVKLQQRLQEGFLKDPKCVKGPSVSQHHKEEGELSRQREQHKHRPRDRRQSAVFKEMHVVWDYWFTHNGKKRETRVWSGLKITGGSQEYRPDAINKSTDLPFIYIGILMEQCALATLGMLGLYISDFKIFLH